MITEVSIRFKKLREYPRIPPKQQLRLHSTLAREFEHIVTVIHWVAKNYATDFNRHPDGSLNGNVITSQGSYTPFLVRGAKSHMRRNETLNRFG